KRSFAIGMEVCGLEQENKGLSIYTMAGPKYFRSQAVSLAMTPAPYLRIVKAIFGSPHKAVSIAFATSPLTPLQGTRVCPAPRPFSQTRMEVFGLQLSVA